MDDCIPRSLAWLRHGSKRYIALCVAVAFCDAMAGDGRKMPAVLTLVA